MKAFRGFLICVVSLLALDELERLSARKVVCPICVCLLMLLAFQVGRNASDDRARVAGESGSRLGRAEERRGQTREKEIKIHHVTRRNTHSDGQNCRRQKTPSRDRLRDEDGPAGPRERRG